MKRDQVTLGKSLNLLSKSVTGNLDLGNFDEELVQIGNDLDEIMSGDARELLDTIRQHDIDIETNSDRVGDQNKNH